RFDVSPTNSQLLGRYTVLCLVINRTIGSGIFTVPPKVLAGTGSVGGSLFVWTACGIISLCGCYCWLELGLSLPLRTILENGIAKQVSTPRSGGEKNFLEYILKKPRYFITCVYGIMFLVLGNISGNAIAFAIYAMIASGKELGQINEKSQRGAIYAISIGLLTFCAGLHIFTRRGGIILSNIFATIKIAMVLTLAILGFVHAGGKFLQSKGINEMVVPNAPFNITSSMINNATSTNLGIHTSFSTPRHDLGSYVESFLFALFAFTGFQQPFYILSEVRRPRRVFPKYVPGGMILALVLYILVNIAYVCVVPKEAYTSIPTNTIDMASTFLRYLFDSTMGPHTAQRVMAGLICVSIFGNVVVMTFTAARVKQEIAKEGILPFSLVFGTGHTTPGSWIKAKFWDRDEPSRNNNDHLQLEDHREKSPMAALALHWLSSVTLIAVTGMLKPVTAYSFLTSLYAYSNNVMIGALISGGLLYLKFDSIRDNSARNWNTHANYVPLLSPIHVVVYFSATLFLTFSAFAPPAAGSPYANAIKGYPWWILPMVCLTSLLWGVFWWLGLCAYQWLKRVTLTVQRIPYIERDQDGNYVQKAELVERQWLIHVKSDTKSERGEDAYEMTGQTGNGITEVPII
ncbi:amino acid transporter, partial [Cenococcum geophilum 1.58]|uniref:amino acid transporter n=1 Tax=Cenococcum geophilum 1.58 TaxID=794803 RepID=UPI00359016E3